jgi:hypothetical protein
MVSLLALPALGSASVTNTRITSGPSGTIFSDSATFTFTSPEDGGFQCRLDSKSPEDWIPCISPRTYSSLADGVHTFEVRAVNRPGNADPTPAIATFTVVTEPAVDTEPPETTLTLGPTGTIATDSAIFAFTSSEEGSFECRLDSSGPGGWAACASPQSYSSLADGPHGFEVRATDGVGNVDPTPAVDTFTVYTGPPKPVAGQSVNLEPVEGTVELRCPGEDQSSRLTSFKQVPVGCLINTRHGVVDLTASRGSSGELQGAHFWGGVFVATQEPGDNQEVDLNLAGKRMCERRGTSHGRVATLSRARGGGRQLWGSGKGNYKTSGGYGSATVRGTTWLVVDRCNASTLFEVAEGTVWVRDFVTDKSVVLEAGEQYLAKAPIPRLDPDVWH